MTEASAGKIAEQWFREFAVASRLQSKIQVPLEQIVRLFDSKLQARLTSARFHLHKYVIYGNEWIDLILSNQKLPEADPQAQHFLSEKLLDLVLATDELLVVKDNQGAEHLIAVDVTADPGKEGGKHNAIQGKRKDGDPRGFNRNANLPLVRKELGIDKHLVVTINHLKPPSYETVIGEIFAFANQSRKTAAINLFNSHAISQPDSHGQGLEATDIQQAQAIAQAVRLLLSELKLGNMQPDGSLAFESRQLKYQQNHDLVVIHSKDGRGEVLRVSGQWVEQFCLSNNDQEICKKIIEKVEIKLSQRKQTIYKDQGKVPKR